MFVLNGYEELESFLDLDESELDYLGIHEVRKRSVIMAAVEWLQDSVTGRNFLLFTNYSCRALNKQ